MVEDMSMRPERSGSTLGQRCWSETVPAGDGLDSTIMPRLVEASEVSAVLSADFAQRWGMAPGGGGPGGAGDNAASAIGLGAIDPAMRSCRSDFGVLFRVTKRLRRHLARRSRLLPRASCPVHQMGVMLSAAASLAWLAASWRRPIPICSHLSRGRRTASPVQFLPYLERRAHAAQ